MKTKQTNSTSKMLVSPGIKFLHRLLNEKMSCFPTNVVGLVMQFWIQTTSYDELHWLKPCWVGDPVSPSNSPFSITPPQLNYDVGAMYSSSCLLTKKKHSFSSTYIHDVPIQRANDVRFWLQLDFMNQDTDVSVFESNQTMVELLCPEKPGQTVHIDIFKTHFHSTLRSIVFPIGLRSLSIKARGPSSFTTNKQFVDLSYVTSLRDLTLDGFYFVDWKLPKKVVKVKLLNMGCSRTKPLLENCTKLQELHVQGMERRYFSDALGIPKNIRKITIENATFCGDLSHITDLHELTCRNMSCIFSFILPKCVRKLLVHSSEKVHTFVNISDVHITEMDLSTPHIPFDSDEISCPNLQKLVIDSTNHYEDFSGVPNIKEICFSRMAIDPICDSLQKLSKLSVLDLSRSTFHKGDLSRLKIRTLHMRKMKNVLTDQIILPKSLQTLTLTGSDVTDLDLSELTNLEVLLCRFVTFFLGYLELPNSIQVLNLEKSNWSGPLGHLCRLKKLHMRGVPCEGPLKLPHSVRTISVDDKKILPEQSEWQSHGSKKFFKRSTRLIGLEYAITPQFYNSHV